MLWNQRIIQEKEPILWRTLLRQLSQLSTLFMRNVMMELLNFSLTTIRCPGLWKSGQALLSWWEWVLSSMRTKSYQHKVGTNSRLLPIHQEEILWYSLLLILSVELVNGDRVPTMCDFVHIYTFCECIHVKVHKDFSQSDCRSGHATACTHFNINIELNGIALTRLTM